MWPIDACLFCRAHSFCFYFTLSLFSVISLSILSVSCLIHYLASIYGYYGYNGEYASAEQTVAEKNGVATQIRSRNHKYSALIKGLIFTRSRVQRLGMGMGRCQAPNPTRPVGRPPLVVFQILIPPKNPLICNSKLTHTNMHQTSEHGICPILIHSIKSYYSSRHIYIQGQQVYHKAETSTRH